METVLAIFGSSAIGYLFGSLSPSALLSKIKKKDIRKSGTKNLGATNVLLNFGKTWFVLVMLFDIFKAFFSVKIASRIFPILPYAGILAGTSSVFGHVFPFYMRFRGGKGLASFAGLLLAYDPLLFLILMVAGILLILIANQTFLLPYFTGIAFPICALLQTGDGILFLLISSASALLLWRHTENVRLARTKSDVKVREYIGTHVLKKNK